MEHRLTRVEVLSKRTRKPNKQNKNPKANDIRRCVASITTLPPPSAPESPFFLTLDTPAQQQCPPLNSTLAQRTKEEWARTLCENQAVAIIQRMQEGKPALIPKECEEILIAIALDRPLKEAQRLVENPERFFNEILEALETHRNHPVLMQLLHDIASASASSVKKRRAQICLQIQRFIKFLQNYAGGRVRQPRTPNTSAARVVANLIRLNSGSLLCQKGCFIHDSQC